MTIDLSLRSLEDMLVCKEKSQYMMHKNNEALLQYVEEIKNLRNLILNDIGQQDSGAEALGLAEAWSAPLVVLTRTSNP